MNLYLYQNKKTGEISIVKAQVIQINQRVERIKIIRNGSMFMEDTVWRIGNLSFYKPLTDDEKVQLL